jgi:hypothetical protein
VTVRGVASYDPYGDNHVEHPEAVSFATDGHADTYWTTEHYSAGLNKPGVGLVLDAGSKKLTQLTLTSDTPGFRAVIKSGASTAGPFSFVSSPQQVGGQTTFSLHGNRAQYYLIWITDLGPNSAAQINEVTARGR